jgi:hypothetical protein
MLREVELVHVETNEPISAENFAEDRAWADTRFREYMHARQALSTLSESTLRRYRRGLPRKPRRTKEEKELLHDLVAAVFTYQQDAVACTQSGADFASGLMAVAAAEVMAISRLLIKKPAVKKTKTFRKLWKARSKRVSGNTITFARFLVEMRAEDLFRVAREASLYDEENLPSPVAEALAERGHLGKLTEFVKKARNCIHPRANLELNRKYAKMLDVFYSPEAMKSFHLDFALCGWELYRRLSEHQSTAN